MPNVQNPRILKLSNKLGLSVIKHKSNVSVYEKLLSSSAHWNLKCISSIDWCSNCWWFFFLNCFLEVRARSLTLALEQNITVLFSVRTIQCCILLTVHAKHVPFKNRLVKTVFFFFLVWKLMRTVGKSRSKRERIFFGRLFEGRSKCTYWQDLWSFSFGPRSSSSTFARFSQAASWYESI